MQHFINVHGNHLIKPMVDKDELIKESESHAIHLKHNLANFENRKITCHHKDSKLASLTKLVTNMTQTLHVQQQTLKSELKSLKDDIYVL